MKKLASVDLIREDIVELQRLQREYFVKFKQLQMLLFLAEDPALTPHKLGQLLIVQSKTITGWMKLYHSGLYSLLGEPPPIPIEKAVRLKKSAQSLQDEVIEKELLKVVHQLTLRLGSSTENFSNVRDLQQWLSNVHGITIHRKPLLRYLSRNYLLTFILQPADKADYSCLPYRIRGTEMLVTADMMKQLRRQWMDPKKGSISYAHMIDWIHTNHGILLSRYIIQKLVTQIFNPRYVLSGIPIQQKQDNEVQETSLKLRANSRMHKQMTLFERFKARPARHKDG